MDGVFVEAALHRVARAFVGRSQSLGNRARLNQQLELVMLQADACCLADRLRERLHPRGGIPAPQRPRDDPRGRLSLLA